MKAIRTSLNMTQEEFAGRFGFSVKAASLGTGFAAAGRANAAYLLVIERAPKAVQKALQAA